MRCSAMVLFRKRESVLLLLLVVFLGRLSARTAATNEISKAEEQEWLDNEAAKEEEDDAYETFFDTVVIPSMDRLELDYVGDPEVEVSASTAASLGSSCAADALTVRILQADRKLLILGGGPAGLTAAIYAARADMAPLVLARDGGQLESTSTVDNFPGFEDGTDAVVLTQKLEKQAARFGADTKYCDVTRVDLGCRPFKVFCGGDGGKEEMITSSALVIATGAEARWLGVEGEQEYLSRGVHTCATCDGFFYKDKNATVIGGGDTAMEQALFLARLCPGVTLVHRGSSFRASRAMSSRALAHPNITIRWNTVVREFAGNDGDGLTHLVLETTTTTTTTNKEEDDDDGKIDDDDGNNNIRVDAETSILKTSGAFVAIGQVPNTQLFRDQVRQNAKGYLYTVPGTTLTSVTGVFAAGDVQDAVYRQAITSAGTGAMAAMDAERWLCEHGC